MLVKGGAREVKAYFTTLRSFIFISEKLLMVIISNQNEYSFLTGSKFPNCVKERSKYCSFLKKPLVHVFQTTAVFCKGVWKSIQLVVISSFLNEIK